MSATFLKAVSVCALSLWCRMVCLP